MVNLARLAAPPTGHWGNSPRFSVCDVNYSFVFNRLSKTSLLGPEVNFDLVTLGRGQIKQGLL